MSDATEHIDNVADDFEARWRAGERPSIEDFLSKVPASIQNRLLLELLKVELELRAAANEPLETLTYEARFPAVAETIRQLIADLSTSEKPWLKTVAQSYSELGEFETLAPSGAVDESPVTKRFGDYELLDEIARGGMGVVYRARQLSLNRIVALKMILSGEFASPESVRRFQIEAEAAANLDHPGIVPIYDVGEIDGHHFFSMGFVDGSSLAQLIAGGPLPPKRAAHLMKQVVEAIVYAHEQGVIHRDLKPANILLDSSGPRVTDFGLAKRRNNTRQSMLTLSGQILGTPAFMPPEQASGHTGKIDELADIYSLGATLYAMITGRPPFQSDNHMDTMLQVLEQEPAPPRLLNPKVDSDLEKICLKCLEKSPQHRYTSAQQLATDLGRYVEGESISIKSINILDRVTRTLRHSKYDIELRTWGTLLHWFALFVLLGEIGIYFLAGAMSPYPLFLPLCVRLAQALGFGSVLWKYRASWSISAGAAARQMLSIWIGFVVSCWLVPFVGILMSGQLAITMEVYPYFAILSGLTFFTLGSSYWGQCYAIGIAFFVLAPIMTANLTIAPLVFGEMWSFSLWMIGRRLRDFEKE